MRALALDYSAHTLGEREVPEVPLRSARDVRFRVLEVGVCGTDRELAAFRLGFPPAGEPYLVLGHEALGKVVQVGPEVNGVGEGDLVVPTVRRACPFPCRWCTVGRRDLCGTGQYTERGIFGAHGYYAETAVDDASDLLVIPPSIASFAVLVEPLSVVEKAVRTAFRLHVGGAESALVIGAGTIGLLTAMALRVRGLKVTVCSLESETSDRAKLAEKCDVEYRNSTDDRYDVVIEAAGSMEAVGRAFGALGPNGVLIVLGASDGALPVALLDLIVGNQIIAGSVNAGPDAFASAVSDLQRFAKPVLNSMVERRGFGDWRSSILGLGGAAPKTVHVLH